MAWQQFPAFASSNISAIRYEDQQLILEVTFHNGGTYQYYDVPNHLAAALNAAGSKGEYLASDIKGNYRYSKV